MKKYLLTALLWVFAFVGFTNATNYTFEWIPSIWYNPDEIVFDNDFTISSSSIVSYSCTAWSCYILVEDEEWNTCNIDYYDEDFAIDCENFIAWQTYTFRLASWDDPFDFIIISDWQNSSGGSDSSSNTPLLSGWTTVFSWIISSLWSVMSEFIPYVAFVGLWLLGAIIGFVAIKRLVNRIRAKILWTFSGWRRRK